MILASITSKISNATVSWTAASEKKEFTPDEKPKINQLIRVGLYKQKN